MLTSSQLRKQIGPRSLRTVVRARYANSAQGAPGPRNAVSQVFGAKELSREALGALNGTLNRYGEKRHGGKKMKMKKLALLAALLFVLAGSAWAQGVPYHDILLSARGTPIGGANVSVCASSGFPTTGAQIVANSILTFTFATSPITAGFVVGKTITVAGFTGNDAFLNATYTVATISSTTISVTVNHANYTAVGNGTVSQAGDSVTSCAPLASIFSDVGLTVPITQPGFVTDGISNWSFYAAPGLYNAVLAGPGIGLKVVPIQLAAGSVSSVALTAPSQLSVSGSPVTGNGTLGLSWVNQNANTHLAGPASGGAAAPSFRALVGADLGLANLGDTLYGGTAGALTTLPGNTTSTKKFLTQTGTGSVSAAPGWNTIAAPDLPATTSNCTGVQFAEGLNAGGTPACATPPTFGASGASHAVGYVPDPGSSAGTTRFLREDATWQVPPAGTNGFSAPTTTTLGANISLTANTATTVVSQSLTMPSTGGPFRIQTEHWAYWTAPGGSGMACDTWVTDGTNNWAGSGTEDPVNGGHSGNAGSGVSTVTYSNSASVTLTFKISCNQAGTVTTGPFVTGAAGVTTLQSTVYASN